MIIGFEIVSSKQAAVPSVGPHAVAIVRSLFARQVKSRVAKGRFLRPVVGINAETGDRMSFASIRETRKAGFDHSAVSRVCWGFRKIHKGHYWEFDE